MMTEWNRLSHCGVFCAVLCLLALYSPAVLAQEESEAAASCPCLSEFPEDGDVYEYLTSCDHWTLRTLIAAEFNPQDTGFFDAIACAASTLTRSEELMIASIDAGEEEARTFIERVIPLARINADRVLLGSSARVREALRQMLQRAPGKKVPVDRERAREVLFMAKKAKQILSETYVDQENIIPGLLRGRASTLVEQYKAQLKEPEVQKDKIERAYRYCAGQSGPEADPAADAVFRQAEEYLTRSLLAAGRDPERLETLRARIYVDRATLRGLVRHGSDDEITALPGAISDAQRALDATHFSLRDVARVHQAYAVAVTRQLCSLIGGERHQDVALMSSLLQVPFSWEGKDRLYLLVAQSALKTLGANSIPLGMLERGLEILLRRYRVGYLEIVEDWPEQYYSNLFRLDGYRLKSSEAERTTGTVLREIIGNRYLGNVTDCLLLQDYLPVIDELGSVEALLKHKSLMNRIIPRVCASVAESTERKEGP